jgi:hypothetical protein
MSSRRPALVTHRSAQVCAILLAAQLTLTGTSASPAAAEMIPERAAPSCNGLSATVVGSEGVTLIGTPGNDVIVTKGATRVDSGAGEDSICVTGKGTAVVNAGPGDDFVGARSHKGKTFVSLGFGDDVFWAAATTGSGARSPPTRARPTITTPSTPAPVTTTSSAGAAPRSTPMRSPWVWATTPW